MHLQGTPSLDPASISQHYSSLCATQVTSPTAPKATLQQGADLYSKGLTAAADIQAKSVKPATLKARQTAVRELADWMHSMHAATGRTVLTAIPEDMVVYFMQHWLRNHAGSATTAGELIAAPGSLSGTKSQLATEFELLGRTVNWDPATQQGNPLHSMQVKNMLKGYANHATELGYQKKGAVPLTQPEMHTMLSSMFQLLLKTTDQAQKLLLVRDGLLFSILWQTCYRGFNAGGVRLENIVLPTGGSAMAFLVPNKLPAGARLHLLPDTTRNKKGGHCTVTLSCDVLCLSSWLQLAVHH